MGLGHRVISWVWVRGGDTRGGVSIGVRRQSVSNLVQMVLETSAKAAQTILVD